MSSATATASAPIQTDGSEFRFRGRCVGGDGPNLSRYPNLVYTQTGGTRTHITAVSVAAIAEEASARLVGELDEACLRNGVLFDELLDALRFARSAGQI